VVVVLFGKMLDSEDSDEGLPRGQLDTRLRRGMRDLGFVGRVELMLVAADDGQLWIIGNLGWRCTA
jgi:hypothetical protein